MEIFVSLISKKSAQPEKEDEYMDYHVAKGELKH